MRNGWMREFYVTLAQGHQSRWGICLKFLAQLTVLSGVMQPSNPLFYRFWPFVPYVSQPLSNRYRKMPLSVQITDTSLQDIRASLMPKLLHQKIPNTQGAYIAMR